MKADKHEQKEKLACMADWHHVQITCNISESQMADMQLHSPFNHECHFLEHTQKNKAANSCRTGLELEFQDIVNIEKEVKL